MPDDSNVLPLDDEQEIDLAHAYLKFCHTEAKTPEWDALFWTWSRIQYLATHLPQKAWRVILVTWSLHQCPRMMGSLSSHIRTLLLKHPSEMLPVIEAEARRDRTFAKLLATIEQITLSDEVHARMVAASEGRAWEGASDTRTLDEQRRLAVGLVLMPHEDEKDEDLAKAFIAGQKSEHKSEQSNALFWTHERTSYLNRYLPHKAWRVILLIWSMDQSTETMQALSAGEIEDLLSRNGTEMIPLVEAEARRDPSFAKLLGGVWKNRMTDEVWSRLQAVWDRRGWDGIPEEGASPPTLRIAPV
jgi:DNA polymerase IIIc chi subunit